MYTLDYLHTKVGEDLTYINKRWVPARPLNSSFWERIRDAWAVLTGRADAFIWPEGQ